MSFHQTSLTRRSFVCGLAAATLATASGGVLSGCAPFDEFLSGKRILADDTGRNATIPTPGALSRIYFTSPLAQIFCFTMAPDLLAGTAIPFTREQLEFLPAGTENLAYMGSLSQGSNIDSDMLGISDVQLIFSISGTDLSDVNIADALALQDETNIPVFLIDGSFGRISDTYRLLGNALGRPERAEELAGYCERIYRSVTEAVARVPESERVRYYFAEGIEGLLTEPDASQHSLAFAVAGGKNVAADAQPAPGSTDMAEVTIEQVQRWNPEVIVSWDWQTRSGADQLIRASSDWQSVSAVRNNRVYAMPSTPFPFCDRPPGVNRFLGIQWLANLFYPSYYDVDIIEAVREFYRVCYWRDISHAQAKHILHLDED